MVLLTRRAVVLAGIETTYNVAAALSAGSDALLVEEPDFQIDPQVLERNFASPDLSPKAHIIGRKLAKITFSTELRGSGSQHSGLAADEARIGRLLRACGYSRNLLTAAEASQVFEGGVHANKVSFAVDATGLDEVAEEVSYFLEVTTGGASGTAQVRISSDHPDETEQTDVTVTTATAITVGSLGLEITPTFTGSLVLGQAWSVHVSPKGIVYKPISENVPSLTMEAYFDGIRHRITGAHGTFTVTAEAGQYAKVDWEFTGQYVPTVDAAMPAATYEDTLPAMVELARLRMDATNVVVAAFNFDQANTISVRPDVNMPDGYNGVRITARNPSGGIDPESTLAAEHDFWGKLAAAKIMPFGMRVGTQQGNTIWLKAPAVQYSGLTYQDRDGIRAYDAGLGFKRYVGDDDCRWIFC